MRVWIVTQIINSQFGRCETIMFVYATEDAAREFAMKAKAASPPNYSYGYDSYPVEGSENV